MSHSARHIPVFVFLIVFVVVDGGSAKQEPSPLSSGGLVVGYFYNLYLYDPQGGRKPLPPNVSSPVELLSQHTTGFFDNYNVVIQSFILPSYVSGATVNDTTPQGPGQPSLAQWRDGVNGKPGLMDLCADANIPLMISVGGGGAPAFITDDPAPLVDALLAFVQEKGYAGIDIDEENTIDTDVYVAFMMLLGTRFKAAGLLVSHTVGPLSCCFNSRAVCEFADVIDWSFLMMYDGLYQSAAFDVAPADSYAIWQDTSGQLACNLSARGPQKYGLVSDVASSACAFINFGLYLNWPPDKLVMGQPLYSYPGNVPWYEIVSNFTVTTDDPVGLLTTYQNSAIGTEYAVSPKDIVTRISARMDPGLTKLGVTLTDAGYMSKLLECGVFLPNSTFVGSVLRGVGFWEMSHESAGHHEVSDAAAAAVTALDSRRRKWQQ